MSDSESGDEQITSNIEHVTGPVEDAWKMKIPEFTPKDNPNGKFFMLLFKNNNLNPLKI